MNWFHTLKFQHLVGLFLSLHVPSSRKRVTTITEWVGKTTNEIKFLTYFKKLFLFLRNKY